MCKDMLISNLQSVDIIPAVINAFFHSNFISPTFETIPLKILISLIILSIIGNRELTFLIY